MFNVEILTRYAKYINKYCIRMKRQNRYVVIMLWSGWLALVVHETFQFTHPRWFFFVCIVRPLLQNGNLTSNWDLKFSWFIAKLIFSFQNRNGKRFVIEIMSSTCSFQSSTCIADLYKLDGKHTRVKGVVYVDGSTENLEYTSRVECPVACLPSIRSVLSRLLRQTNTKSDIRAQNKMQQGMLDDRRCSEPGVNKHTL